MSTHKLAPLTSCPLCVSPIGKNPIFPQYVLPRGHWRRKKSFITSTPWPRCVESPERKRTRKSSTSFRRISRIRSRIIWCHEAPSTSSLKLSRSHPPWTVFSSSLTRHDRNPKFSKSLSCLKIYYSRLTPVISHLLIVNTMLPTH